jgi:hypothetical protein
MTKIKDDPQKKTKAKYTSDYIKLLAVPIEENQVIKGYSINFPQKMKNIIEEENHFKNKFRIFPLKSLSETIQILFTDLLFVNSNAHFQHNEPWLFSQHPIDIDLLKHMIESWYYVHFKKILPPNVLNDIKIVEEERIVKIIKNEQGTADLSDSFAYQYLPKIISATLNKKLFIPCLQKHLDFIEVSTSSSNGVNWISWPPENVKVKKHTEHFSYNVKFRIQTIPFDSVPYLYIHVGILRWMTNKAFIRNEGTTVYLQGAYPWISGKNEVAPIIKTSVKKRNGHLFWEHKTNDIINEMGYGGVIPEIEKVFENPSQYFLENKENKFTVLIPYGSHLWGTHNLGAGAGFKERVEISKEIVKQLPSDYSFPICRKIKSSSRIVKHKNLKLSSSMIIEIWYSDLKWLEKAKNSLLKSLNIEANNEVNVYEYGESTIILKEKAISEQLDVGRERKKDGETLLIERITKMLNGDVTPSFCLFELKDKEDFYHSVDPKDFIRHIFAKHNKLTQFIRPMDPKEDIKKLDHRFEKAVADLLRQAGIVSLRGQAFLERHSNTTFVGLYNIQRNKKTNKEKINYPIMVKADANEIKMALPYRGWVPYHEGLLMLAKESSNFISFNYEQDMMKFLHGSLHQINAEHIVLFAKAQNIRKQVKWFQNRNISTTENPLSMFNNLSIVRLRDEEEVEAPEWTVFGKIENELSEITEIPQSFPTGLFKFNEHVFFSIGSKPQGVGQKINPNKTKIEKPTINFPRSTAVELTIPVCGEDTLPEEIAQLAYQLRKETSLQYDDKDTLMPLPLHLAMKAKEYAKIVF